MKPTKRLTAKRLWEIHCKAMYGKMPYVWKEIPPLGRNYFRRFVSQLRKQGYVK